MLAVFTGVRREQDAIERNVTVLERHQTENGYFISVAERAGRPLVICRTHLGEDRINGIVDQVLHHYPVSAVISARMAPAPEEAPIGDLTICQRVYLRRKPGVITQPSGESDLRLMEMAGRAAKAGGLSYRVGDCLTLSPLDPRPIAPAVLSEGLRASTVDTEGFWLAETAYEHELPFLAVRASIGGTYNALPQALNLVGPNAYVPALRYVAHAITHPGKVGDMIRLKNAVDTACRSLDRFFGAFFRELAEQPMPTPDRTR